MIRALLYKDYLSTKGPHYTVSTIIGLLLFGLVGKLASTLEPTLNSILVGLLSIFLLSAISGMYLLIVSVLEPTVMRSDDGKNQQAYLLSLPVKKKQYVASKYLFLLIAICAATLASSLGDALFYSFSPYDRVTEASVQFSAFLPFLASIFLLWMAVELPFFFAFGTSAGEHVKTALTVLLFFAGLIYLMFGDLTVFYRFNFYTLFDYMVVYSNQLNRIKYICLLLSLLLYGISFCISCRVFRYREKLNDKL